jgi:prephenate dehydratase
VNKRIRIAFQGEKGAFSEMAAKLFFSRTPIDYLPCNTFENVFKAVKNRQAVYGILPVENSLTGSIHQNYDLLVKYIAPIQGEIKLRISHCLIAHPGVPLNRIRRIYSHPQALEQCKIFLEKLPRVTLIPSYDTAGSVKELQKNHDLSAAAIAGQQAALDYKMHVLKKGIENNQQNFTRFLIIGARPFPQVARPGKTSIVFAPKKNIPGVLFRSLSVFALRDIDLLKIESRPIHGKPWQYLFYLDFKGYSGQEPIRYALAHLGEITTFIKILGSYPQGREVSSPA